MAHCRGVRGCRDERACRTPLTVAAVGLALLGLQLKPQPQHCSHLTRQGHRLNARTLAYVSVHVLVIHAAAGTCYTGERSRMTLGGGGNHVHCVLVYGEGSVKCQVHTTSA